MSLQAPQPGMCTNQGHYCSVNKKGKRENKTKWGPRAYLLTLPVSHPFLGVFAEIPERHKQNRKLLVLLKRGAPKFCGGVSAVLGKFS